jgi:hypothetical protein
MPASSPMPTRAVSLIHALSNAYLRKKLTPAFAAGGRFGEVSP